MTPYSPMTHVTRYKTLRSNFKKDFFLNIILYTFFVLSLRLRYLAPFDWKILQIGTLRAKDLRKNVPVFQGGGSTPAPPTPPIIRVVLLQKRAVCSIL